MPPTSFTLTYFPAEFADTGWAAFSLAIRNRGFWLEMIPRSNRPSLSKSATANPRPSSRKSTPEVRLASSNSPWRLKNSRLRSFPLKENPLTSSVSGSIWKMESVLSSPFQAGCSRNSFGCSGSSRATARQLHDHKSPLLRTFSGAV